MQAAFGKTWLHSPKVPFGGPDHGALGGIAATDDLEGHVDDVLGESARDEGAQCIVPGV